jgi:hypothetical protein
VSRKYLYGIQVKNTNLFKQKQREGWDYVLNPDTGELHLVQGGNVHGSCHLDISKLEDFIWLVDMGWVPISFISDGTVLPVIDLITGEISSYTLNKCKHCFLNEL